MADSKKPEDVLSESQAQPYVDDDVRKKEAILALEEKAKIAAEQRAEARQRAAEERKKEADRVARIQEENRRRRDAYEKDVAKFGKDVVDKPEYRDPGGNDLFGLGREKRDMTINDAALTRTGKGGSGQVEIAGGRAQFRNADGSQVDADDIQTGNGAFQRGEGGGPYAYQTREFRDEWIRSEMKKRGFKMADGSGPRPTGYNSALAQVTQAWGKQVSAWNREAAKRERDARNQETAERRERNNEREQAARDKAAAEKEAREKANREARETFRRNALDEVLGRDGAKKGALAEYVRRLGTNSLNDFFKNWKKDLQGDGEEIDWTDEQADMVDKAVEGEMESRRKRREGQQSGGVDVSKVKRDKAGNLVFGDVDVVNQTLYPPEKQKGGPARTSARKSPSVVDGVGEVAGTAWRNVKGALSDFGGAVADAVSSPVRETGKIIKRSYEWLTD